MENVGIFYDHLVYFTAFWYIFGNWGIFGHFRYFSHFGMLYHEKSGNPENTQAKKLSRHFLNIYVHLRQSKSVEQNSLKQRSATV
jgi:hypothetical protein